MAISKNKAKEQESIKMLTILYGAPEMNVSVSET